MSATLSVTQAQVLSAVNQVQDPDLRRGLVDLGMIEDLTIDATGAVGLRVVLTTPACPVKAELEAQVRAAVSALPGVRAVEVRMDARVRGLGQGPTARASGAAAAGPSNARGVQPIAGVAHVIAVSSGKGGVGKSTVAANLAAALKAEGARVGVMDADVYGPNIPTMLGLTSEPKLMQHPTRGELFVPPEAYGMPVMSMGFLIKNDQPLVWRGPMLHSVVSQFCHKVEWGELDYLIVDMPPGTGDVQLSLSQLVPVSGVVLVTTPQEVALQDVRKAYYMFDKVRIPILGVVENMSYFTPPGSAERYHLFGKDGGVLLAKKFGTECLAQLPIVPSIREGGDAGKPLVFGQPLSDSAQAFRELARKVAARVSVVSAELADPTRSLEIGQFS